ncbi:MAG: secretion protein HlyD [Alphaproteobacteria bacterium]|nr:secretion protein HlyD [Alphaproteobacteria bacterium]
MSKKTRIAIAAVVIVVASVLGFGLLGWRNGTGGELKLYGNVDIRQVQLGFRVSGRIARALVDEGDLVKAGTLLARLDDKPFVDALHSAEAVVAQRAAAHDKMVAGPRVAEIGLARAQLAEQQATLDNAERDYTRAARLLPSNSISQSVFDQANATRNAAGARVEGSTNSLRLLEEGYRKEDVAAAAADLSAAEAALSAARTQLEDTSLLAPADGVILSRVREPGAIISPSDVVYVLSLNQPVWVRAYVAETSLGRIHPGMAVAITNDTHPTKPYRGTVGFISPVAEFTPKSVETPDLRTDLVYRLRIVVSDPDPALRQGMPVTVHIAPSGSQ